MVEHINKKKVEFKMRQGIINNETEMGNKESKSLRRCRHNTSNNKMKMVFESNSENESLARVVVSAFLMPLDPTVEEMNDVKTAVSEAVTNAIIHGYENAKGYIHMECERKKEMVIITIEDKGKGMENIEQAMEPLFTTKPEKGRSGMGFVFMKLFMDSLKVQSSKGMGTRITMTKRFEEKIGG